LYNPEKKPTSTANRALLRILYLLFVALVSSCNKSPTADNARKTDHTFRRLTPKESGIDFVNQIENQENFNILTFRNYYNGGGVGIGDINNDGLNDIYFTANMGPNRLYLNKGNLRFEDITESAGVAGTKYWSTGVSMVDVNGDGWIDIYVCNSGDLEGKSRENELFINNGDGTFTERAAEFGLADVGYSTHATFLDYDLDGDLDCFVLNNSYTDPQRIATVSRDRHNYGAPGGDRLYRNDNGRFVDVTPISGIYSGDIDFGLGVSAGDVNGDRYPDLYISNDFWERDYFYINNGDGTFSEILPDAFSYISANSMGSDIADLNNDGHNDIFSTDMLPASNYRMKSALMIEEYFLEDIKWRNSYFYQYIQNALQINKGDGTFRETAFLSGVAATDWSWGALIFDMNNDGMKDIFVSNGIYHDITDLDFVDFISSEEEVRKVVERTGRSDFRDFVEYLPNNPQRNFAFLNRGDLHFEDVAASIGLNEESFSNGSAYGDLDNDGDYDLVINNVNMEAFVYENVTTNQFLKIKLRGTGANKNALGAQVTVYTPNGIQTMESWTARGFQSSVDPDLIFGLGKEATIDSVVVVWPDRKVQVVTDGLAPNQTLVIEYKGGRPFAKPALPAPLFHVSTPQLFHQTPVHQENDYLDYDHERLIPHASSTEGPRVVKGDVNGDGAEDFILLGASGQPDQLFIQRNGRFVLSKQPAFENDKNFESVCAALFDADGDGDLDLVIGSGGNEYQKGFLHFASRFYLNDGRGNFSREIASGPVFGGQIGCIRPYDFDNDGDIDLFVGGAGVPGTYGLIPRSFVLRNEGNNEWTDITNDATGPIGMVKDAVWTDMNDDGLADLVVVGEWMPVTIFYQQNGNFGAKRTVPGSNGWWNTIEMADIDQDGDDDFVLGNWGRNMKLPASPEKPLRLYVNDFDANGRYECILEWQFGADEKPFPFASRKDLTAQLPMLKKNAIKYREFAVRQVSDILPREVLQQAIVHQAENLNSSVLIREGSNLTLHALPTEAQFSPVYAIEVLDLDEDGIPDLLLGGNYYKLKPEIGRLDGFDGGFFKGKGDGTFVFVSALESGLKVTGEVRDIVSIAGNILFARNNAEVIAFRKAGVNKSNLTLSKK
jgi:hypothetical protein